MNLMPKGDAWLLIEFGGKDKAEADANARKLHGRLQTSAAIAPSMKLFDDPAQEKLVWHLREEGLGATAKVPGHAGESRRLGRRVGSARTSWARTCASSRS